MASLGQRMNPTMKVHCTPGRLCGALCTVRVHGGVWGALCNRCSPPEVTNVQPHICGETPPRKWDKPINADTED